ILVTKELEQSYGALVPLKQLAISKFSLLSEPIAMKSRKSFHISKDHVSNDFFDVTFNKNGTFNLFDKITAINYLELHKFENWGDRGDEYTFGRLEPEYVKITNINRSIEISGPLFCDIKQDMDVQLFLEVDSKREKRIGKVKLPVKTFFRFYRDLPRIDIRTELTNNAKDHRLRICFDLPFSSKFTLTSTHFGYIRRYGDPVGDDSYIEKPSGIQPQKRYIRVEDDKGQAAVTLMNKGLPEVELVSGSRLAITLLRSVGWLSRSGIPERPEHAGPYYATPGAQELGVKYTFNYSFIAHSKEEPMHKTVDYSETFSLIPKSIVLKDIEPRKEIIEPLITLSDPNIRISSIRMRNKKLWVTLYNLLGQDITINTQLQDKIKKMARIKIDGTEIENMEIIGNEAKLNFAPYEIMICTLE
ncbi:MAG: glycoside hydrolase family 38 C-terminal domain-containing protein, partial [Candidatus Hodarchaeota archaeon]